MAVAGPALRPSAGWSASLRFTRRALPPRKPQDEPLQSGMRRLAVKAPAELPVVLMAFKVPVLRDVENDVDP